MFGKQDGSYRLALVAQASGDFCTILPAISSPFQVNTRRSRCDNKNDGPALNDTLGKLKGIGGRLSKTLHEAGYVTVSDFLTYPSAVQELLPPKVFQIAYEHACACRDRPTALWLHQTDLLGVPCQLVYERARGQINLQHPKGLVISLNDSEIFYEWSRMQPVHPDQHQALQELHAAAVVAYR